TLADLNAVLAVEPNSVPALQMKGDLLRKFGHYRKAARCYDAAVALSPDAVGALVGRASAHRSLGRLAVAVRDFDAALAREPSNEVALVGRAAVKLALGWFCEATADFRAALRAYPGQAVAQWGRSMVAQHQREAPPKVVLLAGFERALLNKAYVERREPRHVVGGRETFWSQDKGAEQQHLLYYSAQEQRWKCTRASDFERVRDGGSPGYAAAPQEAHLLSPSLVRGWHEWDKAAASWKLRPAGGVCSIGPLSPPLRSVTLAGFARPAVNGRYRERRQLEFGVGGRETYWTEDGEMFLYWCGKDSRWKGSAASHLQKIQGGSPACHVGAPVGADLLSPALLRGWHEWHEKAWVPRPCAGICAIDPSPTPRRTVRLGGFARAPANSKYEERRLPEVLRHDRN
ncbi:unnamed protein product, partial [Prorocentrum cordatum]